MHADRFMKSEQQQSWTADSVLELARSYQGGAVLAAAAELDLFGPLRSGPQSAGELAKKLRCDLRGLTALLDALASLGLLEKQGLAYAMAAGLGSLLTAESAESVLAMVQHQARCLRNWAQLATVVKSGRPAQHLPSVRGEAGEQEAFIGAMHNVSAPNADQVIEVLRSLSFRHLLDVGGASGTWTMAFLRMRPASKATLFDLPHVIPLAERRLAAAGLKDRVDLVPGDFMKDTLPTGTDLAWVSAIVHQNSRPQNRILFAKVFAALKPQGHIAIRDILMDETRTRPPAGALFAINMLVATEGGGTFTVAELREDLEHAGFKKATVLRQDDGMNSVLVAQRLS
jgi:predicted O-methyltransferase YrrM